MTRSLFGTTDVVSVPVSGGAAAAGLARRVSMGSGALVEFDDTGNAVNPHPYVSAVAVVHARSNARDFADAEVARRRPVERLRSSAARVAHGVASLKVLAAAEKEGRVPTGEYEWVEVFDLSGLGGSCAGTPLPANVFDGPRDRWYDIDDRGFVERTAPANHA